MSASRSSTMVSDRPGFGSVRRLEDVFNRICESRPLALTLFLLIYLPPTLYLSAVKPAWEDEFFTLYLSTTPNWESLRAALSTGGDQHPPSFYVLTGWIMHLFGGNPVALRLTAILGYMLMCIGLYEIVRRISGPSWAFMAALLPLSFRPTYYYAQEARGYGLVLGFCTVALLSWLRAADGEKRRVFIPALALALCAAVGSHYYAVLFAVALGLGEVHRTLSRRRLDVPVLLALGGALLPLLLFLPVIRSAAKYSDGFWAIPQWVAIATFIPELSTLGANVLVFGVIGVVLAATLLNQYWPARPAPHLALPPWSITGLLAVAALPVMVAVLAKTVTHAYTPRYAIGALIGMFVFIASGFAHAFRERVIVALAFMLCIITVYVAGVREFASAHAAQWKLIRADYAAIEQRPDSVIVVPEYTSFYRLSFFAPRELASRLLYVSDPVLQRKHLGFGSLDRGMIDLTPWFPLHVVALRDFIQTTPSFLVLTALTDWTWLAYELPYEDESVAYTGATHHSSPRAATVLARTPGRFLLRVHGMSKPVSADHMSSYTRSRPDLPELYEGLPKSGPALCHQYFPARFCPDLAESVVSAGGG